MSLRQQYYKDYYENNKARICEKYWCGVCNGIYTLPNRSNHFKTEKHSKGKLYEAIEKVIEKQQSSAGLVCNSQCKSFVGIPFYKRSVIFMSM